MSEDLSVDQPAAPTSEEMDHVEETSKRKFSISIFDAILGVSLICIALAIVLLIFELRTFAPWPAANPWNTSEILNN